MLQTASPWRNPAKIRVVWKKLEVKRSAAEYYAELNCSSVPRSVWKNADLLYIAVKKVKQSLYRPGQAPRIPGG
jgi:hypothetical protein